MPLPTESDFYATQAGREHFKNQLQSIRYCVQEVRFETAILHGAPTLLLTFPTLSRHSSVRRPATSILCTRTLRAPTTTSAVCFAAIHKSRPLVSLHLTTFPSSLWRTDDIQKGLRPKRSIRGAMAHDISMYAIVQVCDHHTQTKYRLQHSHPLRFAFAERGPWPGQGG